MRWVRLKDLKIGDVILVGKELSVGKFEVAEFKEHLIDLKNWEKIDMNKGTLKKCGDTGHLKGFYGVVKVLNPSELKKLKKIKIKIKMIKGLDEDGSM